MVLPLVGLSVYLLGLKMVDLCVSMSGLMMAET